MAELKLKVSKKTENSAILNSSSASRGHLKHNFDIRGHLVKKLFFRFLKDDLVTEHTRGV